MQIMTLCMHTHLEAQVRGRVVELAIKNVEDDVGMKLGREFKLPRCIGIKLCRMCLSSLANAWR